MQQAKAQVPNCNAPVLYYLSPTGFKTAGEIRIGQGRLYPNWGTSADAYIPENKKTWAMAIAHATQLFRNVTKTDKISPNFYFATTIKESFCGCDPDIKASTLGTKFPFTFRTESFNDGCFQLNEPTAYNELNFLIPQRIPYGKYKTLAAGKNFETAALIKAYYDIFTVKYWEVTQNWKAHEFFNAAVDSNSASKLLAVAYYRGLWYPTLQTVLSTNRVQALASPSISTFFAADEDAFDYQKAISNHINVLENKANRLSSDLTAINPETGEAANSFNSFYNPTITWADVNAYLDLIKPLYPYVNASYLKNGTKGVFDAINKGGAISFRYQFGLVLDKIVQLLPVDDPSSSIARAYGCFSDVSNISTLQAKRDITQAGPASQELLVGGSRYQVYPNPTEDVITVAIHNPRPADIQWSITDPSGRVLLYEKQTAPKDFYFEKKFDISTLPQGIYNLQIHTVGKPVNKRIVKM